jgi:hypothetical protein
MPKSAYGEVLEFNGRVLTIRRGSQSTSISASSIHEVTLQLGRGIWPVSEPDTLTISYGPPSTQWNGAAYVPCTNSLSWDFSRDQRNAVENLHKKLRALLC